MNPSIENPDKGKTHKIFSSSDDKNKNRGENPTLSVLSEQLNNLVLDLIELKSELLQEKRHKEQCLHDIHVLQEEKRKVEQQKGLLNEEIQLLKKQLQETELALKTLEQKFNSEQTEHQADRTQLRELQEKLHQKEQENIEITNQRAETEEIIINLNKKIQNTAIELSNALMRIAELESVNQQLADDLFEQKRISQNKEKEIINFRKENEQLRKQIKELQKNIATLKTYIETQQQLLNKFVKDKEILQGENRRLESECEKAISEKLKKEEQQKKLEQKHREIIEQCQELLRTIEGLKIERNRYQQEYRATLLRNEELTKSIQYWQERVETLKEQLTLIEEAQEIEGKKQLESNYTRLVLAHQTTKGEPLKLGQLLIKAELITDEQLDKALEQQRMKPHYPLGTLLLEQGWIEEYTLFQALSLQKNIPFLFVEEENINIEQAYLLDYSFCIKHMLIPLRTPNSEIVIIATAEPDNLSLLQKIEEILAVPVKSVYSCPTNIIKVIEKIFERT